MKKLLITILLLVTSQAHSHDTTCAVDEITQHSVIYAGQSFTCDGTPSDCADVHYAQYSSSDAFGTTTTTSGDFTLTTTFSIAYNGVYQGGDTYVKYDVTTSSTYTGSGTGGTAPNNSTANSRQTVNINHACIPALPEPPCGTEGDVSGLDIIADLAMQGTDDGAGNISGYTCYRNADGDLCGFNVPPSETIPNLGRNDNSIVRVIQHSRGGRNGGVKIYGASSNAECEQSFIDANPFQSAYASVSTSTNAFTPSVTEGNVTTVTLDDGTKVDIALPTSAYNADGTCPSGGLCLAIIEANDDGKDYATIVANELDPPNTVYENTISLSSPTETIEETQPDTIEIFTTTSSDTPVKDNVDNNSPTYSPTSDAADAVLSGDGNGNFDGSDDGTVGDGNGNGDGNGDGGDTGDGSSGNGTGEETQTVNCGGDSGVSCETTQKKVLEQLKKIETGTGTLQRGTFTDLADAVDAKKLEFETFMSDQVDELKNVLNVSNIAFSGELPPVTMQFDTETLTIEWDYLITILSIIGLMVTFVAYWDALMIILGV